MSEVIDIRTYQQGEEMAQALGEKLTALDATETNAFKELLNVYGAELGANDMQELAALFALPEDQFNVLAPLFKESIFQSLNDNNSRMMMVKSLAANGITIEDLHEQTDAIVKLIEDELKDSISESKITFLKELIITTYNIVADTNGLEHRIIDIPTVLSADAKMPNYAHLADVGADLYAAADYEILPGETVIVNTGVKVAIPRGYYGEVKMKSGIAAKTKLRLANGTGTIDPEYTGEIGIILDNIGQNPETITKGQKIAQLLLMPVAKMCFIEMNTLTETERGEGGYGSTGL